MWVGEARKQGRPARRAITSLRRLLTEIKRTDSTARGDLALRARRTHPEGAVPVAPTARSQACARDERSPERRVQSQHPQRPRPVPASDVCCLAVWACVAHRGPCKQTRPSSAHVASLALYANACVERSPECLRSLGREPICHRWAGLVCEWRRGCRQVRVQARSVSHGLHRCTAVSRVGTYGGLVQWEARPLQAAAVPLQAEEWAEPVRMALCGRSVPCVRIVRADAMAIDDQKQPAFDVGLGLGMRVETSCTKRKRTCQPSEIHQGGPGWAMSAQTVLSGMGRFRDSEGRASKTLPPRPCSDGQ